MKDDYGERVDLDDEGRLSIPARYREMLGLEPGEVVVVTVEDGRLIVQAPARLLAHIQEVVARSGYKGSLLDELIAERRAEAEREEAEMSEYMARKPRWP